MTTEKLAILGGPDNKQAPSHGPNYKTIKDSVIKQLARAYLFIINQDY